MTATGRPTRPPPDVLHVLHVDMDAFFASVEVLEDPSLRGKPVIVGGSGERGVVAACTYEARAYGIHSAMPSVRAKRLCPHAVFLPGRYDLYSRYSTRIFELFHSITPVVEGISLDEAFLDVAGARRLFGPAPDIAAVIRRRIEEETGLTASVGVARCKFLAKLASEAAKPKASVKGRLPGLGVKVVEPDAELDFLHPLPVQALWGVGPATLKRLERFGVRTIGDLAAVPLDSLVGALGAALAQHLHDLSWARDDRSVDPDRGVKSVSHEETYPKDLTDPAALRREVVRLSDAVASRLRAAGLAGRTVTLKVRFHDFATLTRSHTVPVAVDTGPEIAETATDLLAKVDPSPGVRLIGVGVANLATSRQLSLDLAPAGGGVGRAGAAGSAAWGRASQAIDEVRSRFGAGAVGPAAVVGERGLQVKRRGDQQWGPDRAAAGTAGETETGAG